MAVSQSMNFFGLQDSARRDSLILMSVFVITMLVFAWFINIVFSVSASFFHYLGLTLDVTITKFFLIAFVWSYILYKCVSRYGAINRGGDELAMLFGAFPTYSDLATGRERLLHNANAEMAIASTQPQLPCYVLPDEPGINAMVLGNQKQPALVVTQGVIDKLDREEMTAIVAHEYAHVANNDLNLNMRMLIVLAGLNSLTELGMRCLTENDTRSNSENKVQSGFDSMLYSVPGLIYIIIPISLVLGKLLSFFGELIKAGFSRKRELLADAKAVQFTRDGWGLASAIEKGSTNENAPSLRSLHNSDLDHLCLLGPWGKGFFSVWSRNHPAPQSRIRLLEPHFAVKKRSRQYRQENPSDKTKANDPINFSMSYTEGEKAASLQEVENEIAVVLSMMVNTAGYNEVKSQNNFNKAIRTYTSNAHRLRSKSDPDLQREFDTALDTLMKQSPAQRVALVNHLEEIMKHDQFSTPEEKCVLAYVTGKLHPFSNAA